MDVFFIEVLGVVAIVEFEKHMAGASVLCIIVGKFGH